MTRRREFEAVRLHGSSAGGRHLAIGLLAHPDALKPKAGVIVPKALGCAPVRNQLKRRLREIIRLALPALEGIPSRPAFVTIARRASVNADFATLSAEWHRLARKAGLWPPTTNRPAEPPAAGQPLAPRP